MNNHDKQQKRDIEGTDHDVDESSSAISGDSRRNGVSGNEISLTERLTDILVDDGDGDLLLQQSDREDRVLQWLQALDLQVMGACRADERLKPLLKLNVTNGAAEDRLLAHLSQHFEPSEVAMLARCLCIPLVSIRVGKINKQGTLLCPTGTSDDGCIERLSTYNSGSGCPFVEIEIIPADRSGRSFLMKLPDGGNLYFWCSEKSKLLGDELLEKMKDLLTNMPSLAELTGISESRLDCFATHLRSYLGGSAVPKTQVSSDISLNHPLDTTNLQFSNSSSKSSRPRQYGSQGGKPISFCQGTLSPRSSSFKEGIHRNLPSFKSVAKEKFRHRGESHASFIDNLPVTTPNNKDESSLDQLKKAKLPECNGDLIFQSSSFLESLGKSTSPPFPSPSALQVPSSSSSIISPYYCWCPPVASTLQYTVAPQMPISSTESIALPPLCSLLSTSRSSNLLTPTPPFNLSEVPSLVFPPFLPEPLVRLPLSMSASQQIATFTPLMCDPIVHVPVIDICSSGQGYLVSGGHAISTTVPPLITESDSMVENGARETLRLLLSGSSQNNSQLMSVLPSVLTNNTENQSMLAVGSRGLYNSASNVGAITNSIAALGLVSLTERSVGSRAFNRTRSQGDVIDQLEKLGGSGGACFEDEGSSFSDLGEGRAD